MALKPDRKYTVGTDISYFMNSTAERGGIVTFLTGGSGAAMDDSNAVVVPTGASTSFSGSIPAGLLLNDMVNLDLTRQHINGHKDEIQLGGKVTILRQGEVTTNVIDTGCTPTIGAPAYYLPYTHNGVENTWTLTTRDTVVKTLDTNAANVSNYRVGTFKSTKDADGYAKVEINMK